MNNKLAKLINEFEAKATKLNNNLEKQADAKEMAKILIRDYECLGDAADSFVIACRAWVENFKSTADLEDEINKQLLKLYEKQIEILENCYPDLEKIDEVVRSMY